MEVLTSKNRMSAITFLSFYFSKYVTTGLYSNGPANTQYPADSFITHCLISCFQLLYTLPLFTHFKREIQWIFVCIETIIKHTCFSIRCIFETSYGLYILWKVQSSFACFLFVLYMNIYVATLGNVARVYPRIIQGLTFLSA